MIACTGDPVRDETSAPMAMPPANAKPIAVSSRRPNRARRDNGASINQKPSAAEASTGPKIFDAAKAKAKVANMADQGSRPRPLVQATLEQSAATLWARTMELTSIAAIITSANTAT